MSRLVKCPRCEEKLPKDEAIPYKRRYYHESCLNEWRRSADDRRELIDYICKLYNIDAPTGAMLKQIKEFEEVYKYKLRGMKLALQYFHETLENPVKEDSGIGIVPYVYEKAKDFYILKQNLKENLKEFEQDEEVKTVLINPTEQKINSRLKNIDIELL